MPDWYEIRVSVTSQLEEPVANFLFELGCSGCLQSEDALVAYFSQDFSQETIRKRLSRYLQELAGLGFAIPQIQIGITTVPDQDWNAEWKKHFKPLKVSERFVIKPSWENYEKQPGEFVIQIDPKQAFGTGTHETTQMMLLYLEETEVKNRRLLDVGTGTGILAIAAAMLGAQHITALDIDPVAAEAAMENIKANDCTPQISIFTGELSALKSDIPYAIILANINKNAIDVLLEGLWERLASRGVMILSGILADELEETSGRFAQLSPTISLEHTIVGEWAGFLLKKC